MINASSLQVFVAIATLIITLIVILVFGGVVFARTYRKAYGHFFAMTMLGIVLWCIGDLIVLVARDTQLIHVGAEVFYIAPMIIPIFIWFFAISFPENSRPSLAAWLFAMTAFGLFSIGFLSHLNYFVTNIIVKDMLNQPIPRLPGFVFYASFFSLFFTITYITFFKKMRRLKGLNRTQVSYTFYGALAASVPALVTNLSLPVMGQKGIIWLGPFFTLFFAAAVTFAIIKHKLFDIRPVIVRSLGYALTITAVSSIYGFLLFGLTRVLFGLHLSAAAQIGLSISTGVAALVFQNFKKFFDTYTKRLFYRDAYDPQSFFNEYNKALVLSIDLDVLLHKTSQVVVEYLKADFCLVGVKDGSTQEFRIVGTAVKKFNPVDIAQLRTITPNIHKTVLVTDDIPPEQEMLKQLLVSNDIALLSRLTTHYRATQEGLGYLVLGSKKSGNPYTAQDVRAIETITNELIIALQNALRFEEIERFSETLQQKVEDATRQLRESNLKLKKLNESKDDFIGMASHQLRTPLTSVKGYLSLVIDGDAGRINATQRKLLDQAFTSSQRMVYLIADLLNVSRIKTGKFMVERVPTNLSKLVTDEMAQLKTTAASHNIELEFDAPKTFPIVMLDETKTRQVIMNFMDNAIYYTPKGGHIHIILRDMPQSVELEVIDDGIGVPQDERHHLFTKFYRAKNAQRARPDGTGLGLFMAKKVIIAQGGALIFDSKEGVGSKFGFSFPKDMPVKTAEVAVKTAE